MSKAWTGERASQSSRNSIIILIPVEKELHSENEITKSSESLNMFAVGEEKSLGATKRRKHNTSTRMIYSPRSQLGGML